MRKEKLAETGTKTEGIITEFRLRGVDSSSVITVAYEAGGVAYSVTESVRRNRRRSASDRSRSDKDRCRSWEPLKREQRSR